FDRGDGEIQLREDRLARGAAAGFFVRDDHERRSPRAVGRAAAAARAASAIGELAFFDVGAHGVDTTPAELAALSAEHRHCALVFWRTTAEEGARWPGSTTRE